MYRHRRSHPAASWTTITDDVTEADVLEVLARAREHAGADELFAVALVVDARRHSEHEDRGLVWLLGEDVPNASEPTGYEQQVLEGMLRRHDEYRSRSPIRLRAGS